MKILKMFRPSREQAQDFEIVADLDAVVSTPFGFTLHGRAHRVDPINTENFLVWSNSVAAMWNLKNKKDVSSDELLNAYHKTIQAVCPTITLDDIKKCEPAKITALYSLILEHCTGKLQTEKKKRSLMEMQKSDSTK